jgi:hypothetical protein
MLTSLFPVIRLNNAWILISMPLCLHGMLLGHREEFATSSYSAPWGLKCISAEGPIAKTIRSVLLWEVRDCSLVWEWDETRKCTRVGWGFAEFVVISNDRLGWVSCNAVDSYLRDTWFQCRSGHMLVLSPFRQRAWYTSIRLHPLLIVYNSSAILPFEAIG